MKPRNIESIFRLTPLQEGLLFHTLEAPSSGAYFDQFSVRIETGEGQSFNVSCFEQAWNDVVAEHATLRTLFTWEKRDQPLQVVKTQVTLPFEVEDLSALDATAQQERLSVYARSDREQGFILEQAPLTRVRLFKLGLSAYRMVWSFHHLILDGWSVRLLLSEVRSRYQTLILGGAFTPTPAPSFEDFVSWQQGRSNAESQRYWQDYLAGFSAPTTPRIRGDRQAAGTKEAQQTGLTLSGDLAARLARFAKEQRVTLNTLFVAAWGLVLSRYCDRSDVVFGTTSAGRPPQLPGVEGTAGLFINTLPLRLDVTEYLTASDMLSAIQKEQAVQRDHDHVGLSAIQKCSDVPAGIPLFETLVVFENFPAFSVSDAPAFAWADEQFTEYSHYPLALLVVPGDAIELIAVHQTAVLSGPDVDRLLASVVTTLDALMSDQPISSLDCLDPAHVRALQTLGRGPENSFQTGSVVERFDEQVQRAPDRIALSVGEERLSYAQLNERAERLARYLQAEYPLSRAVVIYCQRDHWAIIAQLASLKSGRVYVTMDAKDPASRIDFVLQDVARAGFHADAAGAPVLLTHSRLDEITRQLASSHERIVCDRLDQTTRTPAGFEGAAIGDDDPAYVIYTSGSTGTPKGVLVSHRSLSNSTNARDPFYVDHPTVFAMLSSLATDSSIAGLFWTLCTGGTLVLPAERAELDVEALAHLFVEQKVSHTLCVPSLYGLMLDALETIHCPTLQAIIVAGEACPLSLVRRHAEVMNGVSLYNEYGPSEACVWVSGAQLHGSDANVSIGRPVSNVNVAVVDQQGRLAPLGVVGELWVSGDNLAEGYINRPESSARSFVEHALFDVTSDEGAGSQRYYRTGDKVLMDSSGELEYIGRIDHQLKVRGFRVEPGEVEAALCQHDKIDAAVVLIDEGDLDTVVDTMVAKVHASHREFLERTLSAVEQMDEGEVERALVELAVPTPNPMEPSEQ